MTHDPAARLALYFAHNGGAVVGRRACRSGGVTSITIFEVLFEPCARAGLSPNTRRLRLSVAIDRQPIKAVGFFLACRAKHVCRAASVYSRDGGATTSGSRLSLLSVQATTQTILTKQMLVAWLKLCKEGGVELL